MLTVHKSLVHLYQGKLLAEASTIGLPPGEWPDFIAVLDDAQQGFLFQKRAGMVDGIVTYQSKGGALLEVLND